MLALLALLAAVDPSQARIVDMERSLETDRLERMLYADASLRPLSSGAKLTTGTLTLGSSTQNLILSGVTNTAGFEKYFDLIIPSVVDATDNAFRVCKGNGTCTTPLISVVGGGDLTIAGGGTFSATSALSGGNIIVNATLRSATATTTDATTGSCSSVTVSGSPLDFSITATCTAAQTVNVTFSAGFGGAERCVITPANSAAAAATTPAYQSAGATTSATFTFPAVTAGTYNVHCAL